MLLAISIVAILYPANKSPDGNVATMLPLGALLAG